ncbi:MAG: ABC transporter [Rhodospirillaceae bacterium]|nr:ABC transporter [Rhodospirillaceae bacterium]
MAHPHTVSSDNGNRLAIAGLTLLLILFLSVNVLSSGWLTSARLDLTKDKLYTLSESTIKLLKDVKEPVTFRLYLSGGLAQAVPHLGIYANRVRDLLLEYQSVSNGKVKLEVLDPAPFSSIEDRAVAAGLRGIPAVSGGDNMYFGLVGSNTTDDIETIPFIQIDREAFLEYDLSKMLYALVTSKPTVVGIVSTLPTDGTMKVTATGRQEPVAPYVVRNQIGELFETRFLGKEIDEVPSDVNVLMVVHPKNQSARTIFAIDQYLLAGGKAIIFVDPFAEVEGMQGQMLGSTIGGSSLDRIFKVWGLEYDINTVVGDRLSARKVLPEAGNRPIEYLPWLELRGPSLDRSSPITSGIDVVALASAGHLSVKDNSSLKMTPLLISSPGAGLIDSKKVQGFRNPKKLLREFKADKKQYILAGRVTGSVQTAFPDGVPAPGKDQDGKLVEVNPWQSPILTQSESPLDIIVVADADILADRFWVIMRDFAGQRVPVPTANNGDFVLNSIEALAGSSSLMELRGRGSASRPFKVLQDIQKTASRKFEDKERGLRQTITKTEKKLQQLRRRNPESSAKVVSERDRREMEKMQREILGFRSELRKVRRSLTQDYQRLEMQLWFLNIALVPILLIIFSIALSVIRIIRRRNHSFEPAGG